MRNRSRFARRFSLPLPRLRSNLPYHSEIHFSVARANGRREGNFFRPRPFDYASRGARRDARSATDLRGATRADLYATRADLLATDSNLRTACPDVCSADSDLCATFSAVRSANSDLHATGTTGTNVFSTRSKLRATRADVCARLSTSARATLRSTRIRNSPAVCIFARAFAQLGTHRSRHGPKPQDRSSKQAIPAGDKIRRQGSVPRVLSRRDRWSARPQRRGKIHDSQMPHGYAPV